MSGRKVYNYRKYKIIYKSSVVFSYVLPMIGKLLNHAQMQSTARYAHVMDDAEKAAAARVGDRIAAHVAGHTAAAGRGRRR